MYRRPLLFLFPGKLLFSAYPRASSLFRRFGLYWCMHIMYTNVEKELT